MISQFRHDFNQRFREQAYRRMLHSLDACVRAHVELPIAETPCFFPKPLMDEMSAIGADTIQRLVHDQEYLKASRNAIPPECRAADEEPHPHFVAVDFGLAQEKDGKLIPKLVDLHATAPAFGLQFVLNELYRSEFELDGSLAYLLDGHSAASFWKLMDRVIRRGHHPEHVVIGGIDIRRSKALPDIQVIADRLGIDIVDLTELEPDLAPGRQPRLCYHKGGKRSPVYRIYNYTNPGDLGCGRVDLPFDFHDSFEVEWAGHPNWAFYLSVYALPYLGQAMFLDDWLAAARPAQKEDGQWTVKRALPSDHNKNAETLTIETLRTIPKAERGKYLIQRKAPFPAIVDAPHGMRQPEVRMLYLWPDGGHLEAVCAQARLVEKTSNHSPRAGVSGIFYHE